MRPSSLSEGSDSGPGEPAARRYRGRVSERTAPAEPNASLPLRWSRYGIRQPAGLALIVVGAGLVLPTTAYTLPLGLLGAAVHAAGWLILPAPGGRRLLAAVASVAALLMMTLVP